MLKKIRYILERKQKINLLVLLFVIFGGAFAELLGVSAILPIISMALNPESVLEEWYYVWIGEVFGLTTVSEFLFFLSVLLIIIYILKNIYITMMYSMQYKFIFDNQKKLAVKMLSAYMKQSYIFHVSKNVAVLQRNVTNDVNGFFTVLLNFLQFLAEIMVCFVLMIYLMTTDFTTTVTVGIFLVFFLLLVSKVFKKTLLSKGEESRELSAITMKWLLQSFAGIKEIKVMNSETFFVHNYDVHFTKFAKIQKEQSLLTFIPRPVMETVVIGMLLVIVAVTTGTGSEDFTTLIPTLSVFAVAAFRMLPSFNRITGYMSSMVFNKPSINALYDDLKEIETLLEEKEVIDQGKEVLLNDVLELRNVSFKYPESEQWILEEIELEIKKNQAIAFIGASGAGKSTLADLILGIIEPQVGGIYADGVNIQEGIKSWYHNIGYIPQSIYLMDDTIAANITMGLEKNEIDFNRLEQAIKESQLEEFIKGAKDGVDTIIGDRGVKLSGGQRQRIGIARALYRNPKILILDEATSALDVNTEKEVMESIEGLKGKRTLIIIAHRLSTIENCDVIYEVKNKKVIKK